MALIDDLRKADTTAAHTLARVGAADEGAAQRSGRKSCPCCHGRSLTPFYSAPSVPIHSCILLDTPEAARALPRRPLELAYCNDCGFVFNRVFDPTVMHYSDSFEESQHFSHVFSGFARTLAEQIARTCDIAGKKVVEIGCGKGEFLVELCRLGHASGIGIDPGYRADKDRTTSDVDVRFIVDFFSKHYTAELDADVILCRHTLEHIDEPFQLVDLIRQSIADNPDVWVVFETPDAKRVLDEGAFWDIYYEHCSYFSAGTHARLFRASSFEVTDLSLQYDAQYIIQYAKPSQGPTSPTSGLEHDLQAMSALVDGFPARVSRLQDYWKDKLRKAKAAGERVALWGGGSKAVAFLTTLGLTDEVAVVVDINPFKQGKFMPGTGHAVISPEALKDYAPDLIVVMNPIYLEEVGRQARDLGIQATLAPLTGMA